MEKEKLLTELRLPVWGTSENLGAWRVWHGLNVPCRGEGTMTVFLHRLTSWAVAKMPGAWLWDQQREDGRWLLLCHPQPDILVFFYTSLVRVSYSNCQIWPLLLSLDIFFFFFDRKIYPVVWHIHLRHDYVNGESQSSVKVRNIIFLSSFKV